jgi:DNA-directed RNA polymerase specialized sigma24 family protein
MTTQPHRTFATALESLTHRHQQVLALHELDRLSTERVGDLLGIPTAQARIELLQARLAMRQRLSDRMRNAA